MGHTSATSAQFLQMFVGIGHALFLFRRCAFRTPPRDLHSFYNNLCVSEVAPTWDFIILNKGRMTPPWRKKAKGSQAQGRVQNFNPIFVPSRARVKSLSPNWTTNLHQSDSDRCRSKYDLEIVMITMENVQFDAIQFLAQPKTTERCIEIRLAPRPTRDENRIKILNPMLGMTPLGILSPWRFHPTLI